jgi:hypothetical protein
MKFNLLLLVAALYGCGGGGGDNTNILGPTLPNETSSPPHNQIPTQPQAETNPFFAEKGIELPIFMDYFYPVEKKCTGSATLTSVIDINNDGRKDLFVHMFCWAPIEEQGKYKTGPNPDSVAVFLQNESGKFEYANEQVFGTQQVSFGGVSRKVTIADYNNDGYMDLAYAINREDGRAALPDGSSDGAATVVLSQGNGKYKVEKLGMPGYFHSVESVKNKYSAYDVVFTSFSSPIKQAFRFVNSAWINVSNEYPDLSAATFRASSDGKTIITGMGHISNSVTLAKYELISDQWTKSAESSVSGTMVPLLSSWNGAFINAFSVIEGSKLHVGAAYDESCTLNLTPEEKVFIGKYNAVVIDDYVEGTTVTASGPGDSTSLARLHAYRLSDLGNRNTSFIENEITSATFSFMSCKDINNDGYDDIVVYPLWAPNNQSVIIYLNNKRGRLVQFDSRWLPKTYDSTMKTSLYDDFNNDGIPDIIYYNLSGQGSVMLHKGKKILVQ